VESKKVDVIELEGIIEVKEAGVYGGGCWSKDRPF
jgi:hypothetical protein